MGLRRGHHRPGDRAAGFKPWDWHRFNQWWTFLIVGIWHCHDGIPAAGIGRHGAFRLCGVGLEPHRRSSPRAATMAAISSSAWYDQTPFVEIIGGFRAIVPLVLFLYLILKFLLRQNVQEVGIVAYGLVLSVLGMIIFNVGLSYGLSKLGGQSGGIVPAAFTEIADIENSPLYQYAIGIAIAVFFAWALGFGATLAEPRAECAGDHRRNPDQRRPSRNVCCYMRFRSASVLALPPVF